MLKVGVVEPWAAVERTMWELVPVTMASVSSEEVVEASLRAGEEVPLVESGNQMGCLHLALVQALEELYVDFELRMTNWKSRRMAEKSSSLSVLVLGRSDEEPLAALVEGWILVV